MSPRAGGATAEWPATSPSPFVRTSAREQQRAATRERIFSAAIAAFRQQGFDRASVARIARAAGVSRPSFYAHFPTLDHVLFEWAWRLALQIVGKLESEADLRATLDRLADALIEAEQAVGERTLFRELISVFARRTGPEIDGGEIPVLRELVRRFQQARVRGELRGSMPAEQAARLCLSGVFGHLLGVDVTPAERRDDLRALFSLYTSG